MVNPKIRGNGIIISIILHFYYRKIYFTVEYTYWRCRKNTMEQNFDFLNYFKTKI